MDRHTGWIIVLNSFPVAKMMLLHFFPFANKLGGVQFIVSILVFLVFLC